jgi:hypothetical protein
VCTSTPSPYIEALAEQFGCDYQVTGHPPGIGRDWNFALQCAHTPFVTIAHQDDLYSTGYTQSCLKKLVVEPDSIFSFTDYGQLIGDIRHDRTLVLIIKRALLVPFWFTSVVRLHCLKRGILLLGNPIPCPSVTFNKNRLPKNFAFDEKMKTNLDWKAWLDLSQVEGAFVRVPKRLMFHRVHTGSQTVKTILNSDRESEDYFIFTTIWGKKFARLIMFFYRLSYKLNARF